MATFEEFIQHDIRVGTVVEAEPFLKARVPAIKMRIDFGPLGLKILAPRLPTVTRPR